MKLTVSSAIFKAPGFNLQLSKRIGMKEIQTTESKRLRTHRAAEAVWLLQEGRLASGKMDACILNNAFVSQ